jgi:hypothetical protein
MQNRVNHVTLKKRNIGIVLLKNVSYARGRIIGMVLNALIVEEKVVFGIITNV